MSSNQLWVSSPPCVQDSALCPGLVEKTCVPERKCFKSSADRSGHRSIDLSGMTLAYASSGVSVVGREAGEKHL